MDFQLIRRRAAAIPATSSLAVLLLSIAHIQPSEIHIVTDVIEQKKQTPTYNGKISSNVTILVKIMAAIDTDVDSS